VTNRSQQKDYANPYVAIGHELCTESTVVVLSLVSLLIMIISGVSFTCKKVVKSEEAQSSEARRAKV